MEQGAADKVEAADKAAAPVADKAVEAVARVPTGNASARNADIDSRTNGVPRAPAASALNAALT